MTHEEVYGAPVGVDDHAGNSPFTWAGQYPRPFSCAPR
jgi:hypothetical protein